jgi:hypothetical protein
VIFSIVANDPSDVAKAIGNLSFHDDWLGVYTVMTLSGDAARPGPHPRGVEFSSQLPIDVIRRVLSGIQDCGVMARSLRQSPLDEHPALRRQAKDIQGEDG